MRRTVFYCGKGKYSRRYVRAPKSGQTVQTGNDSGGGQSKNDTWTLKIYRTGKEQEIFKKSSGNVFKDLGLDNAEDRFAKAKIASMIYDIIEKRKLTQKQAGTILKVSQPKISALRNGKLDGFSMERLFSFLCALDQDIDIIIHPKKQNEANLDITNEEKNLK